MAARADRIPVIVGVGQINDRPDDPAEGLDPIGLMAEALRRADADAGGAMLGDCDSLAVVSQLGWPHLNPVNAALAEALGIVPAHREQTPMPNGDSPIRLLHEAANRIGAGEARICTVVGGEALRTAGQLAAINRETSGKPDVLRDASHRARQGFGPMHGLVVPVDVYPLYENALRDTYGQSLEEGQQETGALWSGMSEVAAAGEHAWIRQAVAPEEVIAPSARNRPIAFPYTKLQVANASVNQGAGFIVASLAEAHRRGIPETRMVHIGYGAAAHENGNFLERADYRGSAGLEVSLRRTMELNGVTTGDLDHVELYSCFPCVPKMARRVLDWPLDRPVTVFGGLTFGGGPIGNYMSHAVACMVEKLRGTGDKGLLFANGGYATHNHSILLSGTATGAVFPQNFDFQQEADALRGRIPDIDETFVGEARLETYTVHCDRDGTPRMATIVALTSAGDRTLALVPSSDRVAIDRLLSGARTLIGASGIVAREPGAAGVWRFA